jgi:adenylyltransferase/sulfurtransferase|tara:strand:+ start:903 stop:2015 length:1113 start_codon:yes stop_codon:yes gene_type:complete
MELSKEELKRYSRHLSLPEVGTQGQEKLKQSKVLIIGAGGLGCPAAIYLAAAGVGTIGIVDFDKVELSNLQRQILYTEEDIGKPKTSIIKNQLEKLNKNININIYNEKLTSKNALEIIRNYDVIIDGSDNFPTRYLVNDACFFLKKPNVYGSIFRFDGQASVFNYQNGPCYRCLKPVPPSEATIPNCAEAGVIGVLPGIIGTIQATEAIKIILGIGDTLSGKLLVYNALSMNFKKLNLNKNKNCPICGINPTIKTLNEKNKMEEISVKELKEIMDKKEDFVLIDVREKVEWDLGRIEGAILIPLSQIKNNNFGDLENIDKNKHIILQCRTGGRSADVLNILKNRGYNNLKNLVGGITGWANEIDEKVMVN